MEKGQALILDDEADIRELLTLTLTRLGLTVHSAATLAEARALLGKANFDLCFTDMRLPDGNGHEFIELMTRQHPDTPVAMITAYGNAEAAVQALRAGAFDCVSKPVDLNVLRNLVKTALRLRAERVPGGPSEPRLFGESPAMQRARATIAKLARSQAPVLIYGESGVGKELAARSIHEQGPRAAGPFVPVNCGAIPTELMESEFFGHKKGSFTGAVSDRTGWLALCPRGGTVFLDEVGELDAMLQVKLLRVLEDRTFTSVGSDHVLRFLGKVVAATNRDLIAAIGDGGFRSDLYYRLCGDRVVTPTLRERLDADPSELQRLLRALLQRWVGGDHLLPVLDEVQAQILASRGGRWPWPGNIRELAQCARNVLVQGSCGPPEDLPQVSSAGSPLESGLAEGSWDMNELQRWYARKIYAQQGSYKAAAAKLGIDWRTLRSLVAPEG